MRNVYSNYMDLVSTTIVFVFPKKRLATFTYSVSSTQIILRTMSTKNYTLAT